MGQNEVGYLKGVLTRSGTQTVARQIERNWRIQNQIRHMASFNITVRAQNDRSSCFFHEMHCPELGKVAYILQLILTTSLNPFTIHSVLHIFMLRQSNFVFLHTVIQSSGAGDPQELLRGFQTFTIQKLRNMCFIFFNEMFNKFPVIWGPRTKSYKIRVCSLICVRGP